MARRCESSPSGSARRASSRSRTCSSFGPHDPEVAQRTGPQGGGRQTLGIAHGARQRGRLLEVGVRQRGVAGPVLRLRQGDERVAARLRVMEAELLGHLEAAGEMHRRLLERQQAEARVRPRPGSSGLALSGVGQRRTHGEVVGQLVDVGVELVGVRPLGGHGDLVVVAHPPPAQELAVDGVAHERVGEGVAVADVLPDAAEQA